MRILFHIHSDAIGGYEVQLAHLATSLHSNGHHTILAATDGPVPGLFPLSEVYRCDEHTNFFELLSDCQPDLLLTLRGPLAQVARAGKTLGIPAIWVCGYRPSLLPDFALWRDLLPSLFSHVFVPSEWLRAAVSREIPGLSVSTLPCAVGEEMFTTHADKGVMKTLLGFEEDTPVIAYAARLAPHKRHGDLLEALHRLTPHLPTAQLLLLGWTRHGDEEHWEELTARVARLGLAQRVRFITALPGSVSYFLEAADVFVSPSENEGMGCALLEALAKRLPVIAATPIGCEPLIHNARCGLTYRIGDTGALSRCLLRLLDEPELRSAMSSRGQNAVKTAHCVGSTRRHFLQTAGGLLSCGAACDDTRASLT